MHAEQSSFLDQICDFRSFTSKYRRETENVQNGAEYSDNDLEIVQDGANSLDENL